MKRKANIIAKIGKQSSQGQKNNNLLKIIINETALNQKGIAAHLDISTSTVSAWKNGAPITPAQLKKLEELYQIIYRKEKEIDTNNLELILLFKEPQNISNWYRYMRYLVDDLLHDDWKKLLLVLNDIGVPIPETPSLIAIHLSQYSTNLKAAKLYRQVNKAGVENIDRAMDVAPKKPLLNPRQHKPFDSLVIELMIILNILDRWCNTFLPKTKEGELTNTSQKIKNRLLDVAFLSKKVVRLVEKTGTNTEKLEEKNIEIRSEVNNLIGHLCEELLEKGKSIPTDYFEFVKLKPSQLKKQIEQHKTKSEPHINDYLRYGEREIVQMIKILTKTQNEIIERIKHNEQLLNKIL